MPETITELFDQAVARDPGKPWVHEADRALTYREAQQRIAAGHAHIHAQGVEPGDRVLVTARTTIDYLLAWFSVLRAGAVVVAVNPKGSEAELAGFVAQVRPSLVITDTDLAAPVRTALDDHDAPVSVLGDLGDPGPADPGPVAVSADDLAVMIPTSGTTGRSKLVMQTHRAYVMGGEGFADWMQLTPDDRLMSTLPLFHVNAPIYSVLGSVAAGASLGLVDGFSGSRFLDQARALGATEFNAIGAMLEILMRQPERPDDADNPLRLCYTGPSPTRERQLEIEERFGLEIVCGYAMSETPYGLIWPKGTRPFGTLGSPRQHPTLGTVNHARVMDDGRPVDPGEVGELELRNPAIMRGYFEMPEETAAVLVDGWLRTGDLVTHDGNNTYTFVGRRKEVIRRRGENLSPAEVEEVLAAHPDVQEAAVVGVPSELSEEDVKAFVIMAGDAELDAPALAAFAAERLARFKVPRYFQAVGALPLTPTGRVAKHRLDKDRTDAEVDLDAG